MTKDPPRRADGREDDPRTRSGLAPPSRTLRPLGRDVPYPPGVVPPAVPDLPGAGKPADER